MQIQHYYLTGNVTNKHTLAIVADLHDHAYWEILKSLIKEAPDYITINGDLLYAAVCGHSIYTHRPVSSQHFRYTRYAQSFLREAVKLAPVFFSTGNHELYLDKQDEDFLKKIGVVYLDNSYQICDDLVFAGLSSPYKYLANKGKSTSKEEQHARWETVFNKVDISWLKEFEKQDGYKVLLSHHPEFYNCYLRGRNIDLILSGHAHGGQFRLFGHGLFAYGQGWLPQYTDGLVDGKMVISRGLSNTSWLPRLLNPTQLVYVT